MNLNDTSMQFEQYLWIDLEKLSDDGDQVKDNKDAKTDSSKATNHFVTLCKYLKETITFYLV